MHIDGLPYPLVGQQCQHRQTTLDRADEQVAHERQEVGRRPAVVSVAHTTAAQLRMDGLGPGVRRRSGRLQPPQAVQRATVAELELDERQLEREVRAQARVGDALVEGVAQAELTHGLQRGDHRRVVGRQQAERRARNE